MNISFYTFIGAISSLFIASNLFSLVVWPPVELRNAQAHIYKHLDTQKYMPAVLHVYTQGGQRYLFLTFLQQYYHTKDILFFLPAIAIRLFTFGSVLCCLNCNYPCSSFKCPKHFSSLQKYTRPDRVCCM